MPDAPGALHEALMSLVLRLKSPVDGEGNSAWHRAARAAVLAGAWGYVLKQISDSHRQFKPALKERVSQSLYATASARWLKDMSQRERDGSNDKRCGSDKQRRKKTVI